MQKTGILIVTHGAFGAAMLKACETMLGPQDHCAAISLNEGMGREDISLLIQARLNEWGPCLIMVDMLGGTPWNAALGAGLAEGVEIMAGLSMPLLLEALTLRDSIEPRRLGAVIKAKESSVVALASSLLGGNR